MHRISYYQMLMFDILRKRMNRLYHMVSDAFQSAGDLNDWDIKPESRYVCLARNSLVEVRFTIDPRNDQVGSRMVFLDRISGGSEPLYGHIVGRLFGDNTWCDPEPTDAIEEKIMVEVTNLLRFLSNMAEADITGRDLHFYFIGFNSGYSYRTAERERKYTEEL
jgi:hypothetical protein